MATLRSWNKSELQLYQVLHKANLMKYFDTFIAQGGDDVQQLCEAGEDEFLEIMALVGMANKPLHVRRLQKALQEFVTRPSAFDVVKKYPVRICNEPSSQNVSPHHSMEMSIRSQSCKTTPPQSSPISNSMLKRSQLLEATLSECSNTDDPGSSDSQQEDFKETNSDSMYNPHNHLCSSFTDIPQTALLEHQVDAIATAATMLAPEIHPLEPKSMPKKPRNQEITSVMQMSKDDPNRMKALRKYAAIYGRFDSKRKNTRPMSLHEISVNEAAAQLCSHVPALLTRREELFPLARQVVRDSGYQYSKGHSRASEILVQSKLESEEAMSFSPGIVPCKLEDSLSHLQSELVQVSLELAVLTKEQDCIRRVLRKLLEGNDHSQMKRLTAQMDILNDRQTAMVKKRQWIVETIERLKKDQSKDSTITDCVSQAAVREPSSRDLCTVNSTSNLGRFSKSSCFGLNDELLSTSSLNTLYMAAVHNHKDSLFQEGLRIAMQYGMSDFAKELIGMKFSRVSVDSSNNSGSSASPECYSSPALMLNSSPSSSLAALSSHAVASSSSSSLYSVSESEKSITSPSSSTSSSPAALSDLECVLFSNSLGRTVSAEAGKEMSKPTSSYQVQQ